MKVEAKKSSSQVHIAEESYSSSDEGFLLREYDLEEAMALETKHIVPALSHNSPGWGAGSSRRPKQKVAIFYKCYEIGVDGKPPHQSSRLKYYRKDKDEIIK